jgi:hypothetical protein
MPLRAFKYIIAFAAMSSTAKADIFLAGWDMGADYQYSAERGANCESNALYRLPTTGSLTIFFGGTWNIYGPGSNRWTGAAGSDGVPAASGWPAPGQAEGCLLYWTGADYHGCVQESQKAADQTLLNPPIYEVTVPAHGGFFCYAPNDDNANDNEGAIRARIIWNP